MLIQVFDDLEDLKNFSRPRSLTQWLKLRRTLPFIYTIEVLSPSARNRFLQYLHNAPQLPEAAEEALHLINHSGAALYINVEIARHQEEALLGLGQAEPLSVAAEKLVGLLDSLVPL
jgi:geranylgeranyl pyrophosphate synthase